MKKKKAFTLLEALLAFSLLIIFLPLLNIIFYGSIHRYAKVSELNRENEQIYFAETYLKKISHKADAILHISDVLIIKEDSKIFEIGVKNKKLYVMQTATRYLTVEPMLIESFSINKKNDNYFEIILNTNKGKTHTIQVIKII
jgi:hypothetical protein